MAKSSKNNKKVFAGVRRPHKKAELTPPKPCNYMGKQYASITEGAKDTKKSRTSISKLLRTGYISKK